MAIGACLLLLIVPYAMCSGLSPEPRATRARQHPTPMDDGTWEEEARAPETAPEADAVLPDPVPAPPQSRTLAGEITDPTGDPIAGAELSIGVISARSDPDGRFEIADLAVETVSLRVKAFGYRDVALDVGPEVAEQRVTLTPTDAVTGMVLDPEGEALSGATVRCTGRRTDNAQSDAQGRFTMPTSAAGCDAVASHAAWAESPRVEMKKGPNNFIAVRALGSIKGTVVDSAGTPYRGFVLSIHRFDPADGKAKMRPYRQTFAHPQGRFQVTQLHAGTYVFTVSLRGRRGEQTQPIPLRAAEQLTDVKIVID